MIEVEALSFKYLGRKRPALRDVSFQIRRGESLLVLGPSGSGKSTLALALNGLIPHSVEGEMRGAVRVAGLDTREASPARLAQTVGIVFQDPEAQFCMLTVEEEVAFGLENLAVPQAEMDDRIEAALASVGLLEKRRERIDRLSGGQKQRLALACVLAMRPPVLVLDEPTAQLDPGGAAEFVALIGRLRDRGEHTIVVVEHRLDELMHLVDRVLVLDSEGAVRAEGPPREVIHREGESLAREGIWVPRVSELALALEREGVRLPLFPLTVTEATRALRPAVVGTSLSRNGHGIPDGSALRQTEPPFLKVRALTHRYPGAARDTLRAVSCEFRQEEVAAIVGANGAGKSTLARHVAGILTPPPGTAWLRGRDLRTLPTGAVSREVGYVFQYPEHQFLGRSLLEDVAYGPRHTGIPEEKALRMARAMLEDFSLEALESAHPFSLSHGEQRRLSVAAMLVLGQTGLILDEPTFGQDKKNARMLVDKLTSLAERGKAIVAVTHDMNLVADRADRVIALAEGRLVFDGFPERLFADPELLRRIGLVPPPLWRLGRSLGLANPPTRLEDWVALISGPTANRVDGSPPSRVAPCDAKGRSSHFVLEGDRPRLDGAGGAT